MWIIHEKDSQAFIFQPKLVEIMSKKLEIIALRLSIHRPNYTRAFYFANLY